MLSSFATTSFDIYIGCLTTSPEVLSSFATTSFDIYRMLNHSPRSVKFLCNNLFWYIYIGCLTTPPEVLSSVRLLLDLISPLDEISLLLFAFNSCLENGLRAFLVQLAIPCIVGNTMHTPCYDFCASNKRYFCQDVNFEYFGFHPTMNIH